MKGGMSEEEAISAAQITDFKPKLKDALPIGEQIVTNTFGKAPSNVMIHYGQGQGTISKGWDSYFIKFTGKPAAYPTNTPKTDMMLPGKNISLKKYGPLSIERMARTAITITSSISENPPFFILLKDSFTIEIHF